MSNGEHDNIELGLETAESLAIDRQFDFAGELVSLEAHEAMFRKDSEIAFRAKNPNFDSATKAAAMRTFKEGRESMELLLGNPKFLALVKVEMARAGSLILGEKYGELRSSLQSLIRDFYEPLYPTYDMIIDAKCHKFIKHYLEPLTVTLERLDYVQSQSQNGGRG